MKGNGVMTIEEFQNVVWNLANKGYVRYWLHWPNTNEMVIQFKNTSTGSLRPEKVDGMEELGFKWNDYGGTYSIEITEHE